MAAKYTPQQFWELYKKLPEDLQDALFADKTTDEIYDICERNGVLDSLEQIVEHVGYVLLGVLPPADFQETLEKELNLEKDKAKKVSQEINRFVFYPVKANLESLYKIEITPPPTGVRTALPTEEMTPSFKEKRGEKPLTPSAKDVYREPIK